MSVKEYISAVTDDRAELRKKLLTAQYYMGHPLKHIEFNSDWIKINDYDISLINTYFTISDGRLSEAMCVGADVDHVYVHCGDEFEMITDESLSYSEMLAGADAVGELLPPEIFVFKIELYKGE
jgi:hypothetical protein